MHKRKVNKTKQVLIYIVSIFVWLGEFIWKAIKKISKTIANLYIKLSKKLSPKVGNIWAWVILIASTIIIISGLVFVIQLAVEAYNDEMYKQYIIQSNIEEQERIEAEQTAKQEEEETRQWMVRKEIEVTYTLKALGLPYKRLNVPILYQHPEYPSACECIALTNMLNYYGFNLSKGELIENYLIYDSDDWVHYYVGNPYDPDYGGIMMCPGVKILFDEFIAANPTPFKGFDVTGRELEDLFSYIERGHPVQIWSSLNMDDLGEPTSTTDDGYSVYWFSHSVLLTGFDRAEGIVYVADSINGDCYYSIDRVKEIYEMQNKQAFVIISQEELDKWIQNQDWSYDDTIPKDIDEDSDEDESSEG